MPDFTKIARCPECGQTAPNITETTDVLRNVTYYTARHIPPDLIFTCANPECPYCDRAFYVPLSLTVTAGVPEWREP